MVKAFRMVASFAVAIAVVLLLMITGLKIYGLFDEPDEDGLVVHSIELLDPARRKELAAELGEDRPPEMPGDVERLELPGIETKLARRGFVELEIRVGNDGRVSHVRVIDAFPKGIYEEQAIREVRQRQFAPAQAGTESDTRVEVVEFSVPGNGS